MVDPAALPEGIVTFLFTDLEGSTRLLQAHPDAYRAAVARHHALLAAAVAAHGGAVFETVGDAVYAAFERPTDAVAAALAGQRALQAEDWGDLGPGTIRARMGLHSGEVERQGAHYFGAPLYRCARLTATAHGGQAVLSEAAAALVRDALPAGAALRDLGEHRLKDLQRPERVFQLTAPGLPGDFPPLRSLDALPHNLPLQLTSFIGRERELAAVRELLAGSRLVTLTGSGGTGKTRLALQVAADVLHDYPDGIWFVELAPLADPALVPQAVAQAVGVREQPGRPPQEGLADALTPRRLLLVLDNCEHLLGACARLADALLRACPRVQILATSREALGLGGEVTWRVPSLALPDPDHLPPLAALTQVEAVALFVARARAVGPTFRVTDHNAPAVAQICARLDGLPLALELAAARVRVLPPEQLLGRLEDRFRLLTGGSRAAPPRQQTLRATVAWSHALLAAAERTLLRRLAVFAGGWTLEAAEAVGAGAGVAPDAVLDLLTALVDQSLVVADAVGDEARYRLPETIRQYARERLEASGEAAAVRRRHARFFLALAEAVAPRLRGPEQGAGLRRLAREHDNLRAALGWSRSVAQAQGGVDETGLRLGSALAWFWYLKGFLSEGRGWLAAALAARPSAGAPRALRGRYARALADAGMFAAWQNDHAAARAFLDEGLPLARELGDARTAALALTWLGGAAKGSGDSAAARPLHEEAIRVARASGDAWVLAFSLAVAGALVFDEGRDAEALARFEESAALFRALGDDWGTGLAANFLGAVAHSRGEYDRAVALYERALALQRALGEKWLAANLCSNLGWARLHLGDPERALGHFREALALAEELANPPLRALGALGAAGVLAARGDVTTAAVLLGAATPVVEEFRAFMLRSSWAELEWVHATVRGRLGEAEYAVVSARGRALTLQQAVADVLEDAPDAA